MRHRALFSSSDQRADRSARSSVSTATERRRREKNTKKKIKKKKKNKVDDLQVQKDDRMSPDLRIDFAEKGVAADEFAVQIG